MAAMEPAHAQPIHAMMNTQFADASAELNQSLHECAQMLRSEVIPMISQTNNELVTLRNSVNQTVTTAD